MGDEETETHLHNLPILSLVLDAHTEAFPPMFHRNSLDLQVARDQGFDGLLRWNSLIGRLKQVL